MKVNGKLTKRTRRITKLAFESTSLEDEILLGELTQQVLGGSQQVYIGDYCLRLGCSEMLVSFEEEHES